MHTGPPRSPPRLSTWIILVVLALSPAYALSAGFLGGGLNAFQQTTVYILAVAVATCLWHLLRTMR